MIYIFRCDEHGEFETERPMAASSDPCECPKCGETAQRVYLPLNDIWHTQGAHKTDYFSGHGGTGTRGDQLARRYEQVTGEKAPPPAPDVPRNAKERY